MLRVGLTGGIACGKSTIAAMLAARGAHFLQADLLAHQLYEPGAVTYDAIVKAFGSDVLNPDRTVNRARLANAVFPDRIAELNAIVHPAVIKAQTDWMAEVERKDPAGIAVVEAALLIEAGAQKDFDKVIVVVCNFECKVRHYAQRTGLSPEAARAEILRRSRAQLSDHQKARLADYVVENSGSLEDAQHQVDRIWQQLKRIAAASSSPV
jgi:dephospho-CoA kinase